MPFTVEQFFGVFTEYNTTLWPAPVVLTALALAAVVLMLAPWGPGKGPGVAVSAILCVLWVWIALAYHLAFFSAISRPAYVFAAVSMLGASIFFWQGVVRRRLEFRWAVGARGVAGLGLIVFALLVYPAWGFYAGHRYPALTTFGLPCPTTIFTIGILAFAVAPYPRSPLLVPILWTLVGAQAAFLLSVPQDMGLVVAGLVGIFLLASAKRGLPRREAVQTPLQGSTPP